MTSSNPLASVIIPTYNRRQFVLTAIASVLNQTYSPYELIVIDDASTDDTVSLITEKYPQLTLIRLPQNQGAAAARNAGIAVAQGEVIAFLDSDDIWEPNYLEQQVRSWQSHPNCALSYCYYCEVKSGGTPSERKFSPWPEYPDPVHQLLMENIMPSMSIVVVDRAMLQKAGPLNQTLRICHDRELFLRLLFYGEMAYVPEILVTKIVHGGNLVGDFRRWAQEAQLLVDIFFSHPLSQPYRPLEAEIRSHWAFKLANFSYRHDPQLALQLLGQCIYFSPTYLIKKAVRKVGKKWRG
jgi:glycosyltransferase involved in cell wall biosynthesis